MIRAAAILLLLLLTACHAPPAPPAESAANIAVTPDPAWNALFTRTDGWTGADGAATIPLSETRTLWLFGDTWIGAVRDNRHAEGSTIINNTIAIQYVRSTNSATTIAALSDGGAAPRADSITFHWNASADKPAAWAVPNQPNEWFWPANGIHIQTPAGDRLLLFMTRIARRGDDDSVWNFTFRGTSLLIITNPADDPAAWQHTQHTITTFNPGDRDIAWGAAVLHDPADPAHLLIYGIDSTHILSRTLLLARAPLDTIEDPASWRYHSSRGWSPSLADAAPIARNVGPELTIHYLPELDRFLLTHSEPPLGAGIIARTARTPLGPWSAPKTLYTCPEPAADPRNLVYAAKAHPELSRRGELLLSYCVNSTDFWHMCAHADLYLPRFVRVPIALLPH
jgi:hypothetical protein